MNGRFFLDTNIFVYCFDSRATEKARRAKELVLEGITSRKGVVSYQVVHEFFNLALRKFADPMTLPEAEQYLNTIFRPLFSVQSSHLLVAEALHLTNRHRLSWYDSLVLAAALEGGCSYLYTEDLQHGQRFEELQVRNPFL